MRRSACLSIAAVFSLLTVLLPLAATADSSTESAFISDTNSARSSHGLHRYAVASDLTALARRWAAHMAAHRQLAHNPSFASQVCCWTQVGENVGVGRTVSSIQRAFMASSSHRANILSSSFTQVGIGTARGSDGRLYVDELFRRPTHAAPRAAHPVRATTVVHSRPSVTVRASRSAIRHPRVRPVHRPSAREVFLSRLQAAKLASVTGYVDPVGGALAYLLVVQRLSAGPKT